MEILLDIPFDENVNSKTAYDYSGNNNHGAVHGATFHSGHSGYAIHFDGNSYVKTKKHPFDLTKNFTISFWLRTKVSPPYAAPELLSFQFAFSPAEIVTKELPIVLNQWQHIVWARDGDVAYIYADGVIKETMSFTGNPVEWAIMQLNTGSGFPYTLPMTFGENGSPYGMGDMDQLLIFDQALTPQQVNEYTAKQSSVFYKINGIPFLDYDVNVSQSFGLVDALETKEGVSIDWPNEHGQIIDLQRIRFKSRQIKLKCWMKVDGGFVDFVTKTNDFIAQFTPPNLHRLKVEINKNKPLEYEVYMASGTNIDKNWNASEFVGSFDLELVEPEPVKRILRFEAKGTAMTATITLKGKSLYNFYWGDKKATQDVDGDSTVTVEHTYTQPGIYFIVIAGNIDEIDAFIHNGIMTWTKL